jgi:hypothetical protein
VAAAWGRARARGGALNRAATALACRPRAMTFLVLGGKTH